ncbi:MAG TPA: mechanosensitive ion channel family protein [Gemmatimonadales bacterium]|nr:mechanosensitive ion channel family protein [Gemmatimonadales bacterium]
MNLLASFNDILDRIAAALQIDGELVIRIGGRVLGIWLLAWLALRAVKLAARRIEKSVDDGDDSVTTIREKRGRTVAQLLRSIGRVAIITVAVLLTFNAFINIAPVLAGAGILGLAISFGAQSLVRDIISGFFILMENQFAVGDVIEAAGKNGVVEKMTLRVVVLRDLEGTRHVIPNGQLTVVSNKTRDWARAVVDVSIPYSEDVDRIIGVVRDETAQFGTDAKWCLQLDGAAEVLGVESMTDNSVVIRTLLKTQPGSQWSVEREFRRRLINRFAREAVESPFQQRRVHVTIKGGTDGEAIAAAASGAAG